MDYLRTDFRYDLTIAVLGVVLVVAAWLAGSLP